MLRLDNSRHNYPAALIFSMISTIFFKNPQNAGNIIVAVDLSTSTDQRKANNCKGNNNPELQKYRFRHYAMPPIETDVSPKSLMKKNLQDSYFTIKLQLSGKI